MSVRKTVTQQLNLIQRFQIETTVGGQIFSGANSPRNRLQLLGSESRTDPVFRKTLLGQIGATDQSRRVAHKALKEIRSGLALLRRCLDHSKSPEMIPHRLVLERREPIVSTATVYRWIKAEWAADATLYLELKRGHLPYRRGYGFGAWRFRYKIRLRIEERSLAAGERSSISD